MVSKWQPLGEFITLVSGNTPSKSNPKFWGGTVPWVSAKDMSDFWLEDSEDHLTALGVENASRIVPAGTALMLVRGMTLHNRVPICRVTRDAAFNQDVKAVLPKEGLCARFLPYLLIGNHDRLHKRVDSAGHGTGRLNTDEILSLPVFVPSKEEQAEIATIGEGLDERIDNLHRTNATLEAIAAALFKSWFVDFDGVAPEDMRESEQGSIPKGWRVEEIGKLVQCVGGATPSTKDETFWEGGIHHWATPKDLSGLQSPILTTTERLITDAGVARISSGLLPEGTLLMSSRAPIGYLAISTVPIAINQGFIAMPPGSALSPVWLLFWAKANMETIKQKANGSTFMEISKTAFRPIKVVAPTKETLAAFDEVVAPIIERIKSNEQHSAILAQQRDSLLPRLISGKLRAKKVEHYAKEYHP